MRLFSATICGEQKSSTLKTRTSVLNIRLANFVRFCELVVKIGSAHTINLTTGFDDESQRKEADEKFQALASSLIDHGIKLNVTYNQHQHDREIRLDNGWKIKVGRGFDIYQKPDSWFSIGANDLEMRPCLKRSWTFLRAIQDRRISSLSHRQ